MDNDIALTLLRVLGLIALVLTGWVLHLMQPMIRMIGG